MNSLDSCEGVPVLNTPILNEDGQYKTFMIKEPGAFASFRCDCGSNCFHKYTGEPDKYYCNACEGTYTAL